MKDASNEILIFDFGHPCLQTSVSDLFSLQADWKVLQILLAAVFSLKFIPHISRHGDM